MATIITSTNGTDNMNGFALRTMDDSVFLVDDGDPQLTNDACPDVPSSKCDKNSPYVLPALASTTDANPLYNDFHSVLYKIPVLNPLGNLFIYLGTVTFELFEYTSGAWSKVADLDDSTYGTYYPLGTYSGNEGFTGYRVNWRLVLTLEGEGFYRVRATRTIKGVATEICHPIHCLNEYSEATANQTVRFEWNNNGIITFETGTEFNLTNYGNINWSEMIRLKGFFGHPEDVDEVIDVSRARDNYYETARVRNKKSYKYTFSSSLYPDWVHAKLKDIAFLSNSLQVTDYNILNKHKFERYGIIKDADGYAPNYEITHNKCYRVEVGFNNKKEDLGLRQCKVVTSGNCADVTIKDQDGNVVGSVPSGGTWVDGLYCPSCPTPPTKTYVRQIPNIQRANFLTNDVGWYLANTDFWESPGIQGLCPVLDKNDVNLLDSTVVGNENAFGNFNRFTNDVGGTVTDGSDGSTPNYGIDHFTGYGWQRLPVFTNQSWTTCAANCRAYTLANVPDGGNYTDWRMMEHTDVNQLAYGNGASHLFINDTTQNIWLMNLINASTAMFWRTNRAPWASTKQIDDIAVTSVSASRGTFICRNHY